MAYKSPIELICDDIQWTTTQTIVKAVQRIFPLVDEEELAKALKYDRDQYAAGFLDGRAARDAEIVRCKDCKHNPSETWFECPMSHLNENQRPETAWCWKGERRDDG